nr:peptide chain release factor N(5)-glutamine methyltransferase [Allomuricauda sp.]
MLLRDIKTIFHKELDAIYAAEEVDSFFYRCIEHYFQLERFVLVLQPKYMLTKEEEAPLFHALSELKLKKPIQYILGVAHFMDLELKVDKRVLIPRPETEELVEWIISERGTGTSNITILDIGTGSGCIAIALAKKMPQAKVFALDVSVEALQLARENANLNGVQITFLQHNILDPGLELANKFDIIVSNPPYVRELEKEQMKDNVKKYEPHLALFVANEDPLLFYRAITNFAACNLRQKGKLYFEINQYLGKEARALLEAHNFLEIELRKDLFGNDRMLKGQYH